MFNFRFYGLLFLWAGVLVPVVFAQEVPVPLSGEITASVKDKHLMVGTQIKIKYVVQVKEDAHDVKISLKLPDGVRLLKGKLEQDFMKLKAKTKVFLTCDVRLMEASPQTIIGYASMRDRYDMELKKSFVYVLNQKALPKAK